MAKFHDYDALPTDARAPSLRQELRVVVAVLLFILVLEIIARIIAPHLDYDRENIYQFPEVITQLEETANKSHQPRVVFFGNSLMLHGLDASRFETSLVAADGPEVETAKITPVGTAMLDWIYLYRRYFDKIGSDPDYLIVGFVGHHIHDQEAIKLRRLSRHFVQSSDLPTLWGTDLDSFHQQVQSTLCHFSALEGDQPEYPLGILSTLVTDYKPGLRKNNQLVSADKKRKAKARAIEEGLPFGEPSSTYHRMTRFIQFAKSRGVTLIFVPMPQPEVWDFKPAAAHTITSEGALILDARQISEMTEDDFSDGYHLGETGKEKFSIWLANEMKHVISKPLNK